MPKGFHFGRQQTRNYTTEYQQLHASTFKTLSTSPEGTYRINCEELSENHKIFTLHHSEDWQRLLLFNIAGKKLPIPLSIDTRSASKKLYLICPYCLHQRESLFAMRYGYSCRICANLHYPSQSEREYDRLFRKIRKQRRKIWGNTLPCLINDMFESSIYWPKPKNMKQKSFTKQQAELQKLEQTYHQWIKRRFGNLIERFF